MQSDKVFKKIWRTEPVMALIITWAQFLKLNLLDDIFYKGYLFSLVPTKNSTPREELGSNQKKILPIKQL